MNGFRISRHKSRGSPLLVRGPDPISGNGLRSGPRTAILARYWVFDPLAPPVIGVITSFRNHTTS
jgi:hypothetical protein